MATKKRSTKKRVTSKKRSTLKRTVPKKRSATKEATPKQCTPDSRATKSIRFDREDKALLASHPEVRERILKIFSRPLGFRWDFQAGEEPLTFMSHHRLANERPKSESLRKALKVLGSDPNVIKMAVETIEEQSKKPFPKLDHARYDLWFRILPREIAGEKIRAICASTPESLAKWEQRLNKCGRSWESIRLTDGAVIDITKDLFKSVLGREVTEDAISRFYYRWKKKQNRILHGLVVKTFTARWNILDSDP